MFQRQPYLRDLYELLRTCKSLPETRPKLLLDLISAAPTTNDYNRFLYEFTRIFAPLRVVETGTDRGRSAAHFALGWSGVQVWTIDIDPACSKNARDLGLGNLNAVTGDAADVDLIGPFDVLFIDSLHTQKQARRELDAFRYRMNPGAVVFYDDIHLSPDMIQFWQSVPDPKIDLSELHFSGFGASIIDGAF